MKQAVEILPDRSRRFLEMRFQHAEVRQVRLCQQKIGKPWRHILAIEGASQAKPDHLRQRQIERPGRTEFDTGPGVCEIRREA